MDGSLGPSVPPFAVTSAPHIGWGAALNQTGKGHESTRRRTGHHLNRGIGADPNYSLQTRTYPSRRHLGKANYSKKGIKNERALMISVPISPVHPGGFPSALEENPPLQVCWHSMHRLISNAPNLKHAVIQAHR